MSVIVNGMDMPENCLDCQFSTDLGDCYATFSAGADFDIPNRPENCPLVELPKKHGRLIDGDELKKDWENGFYKKIVDALIDEAPTVLEAEE